MTLAGDQDRSNAIVTLRAATVEGRLTHERPPLAQRRAAAPL